MSFGLGFGAGLGAGSGFDLESLLELLVELDEELDEDDSLEDDLLDVPCEESVASPSGFAGWGFFRLPFDLLVVFFFVGAVVVNTFSASPS